MKLHLPKQLFTALLTVLTLAAAPVAKGITVTEITTTTTLSGDTLTKNGYAGVLFNYTVDAETGIGTFTNIDATLFTLTFTLNNALAAAAGQTTNSSGASVGEGLVYVNGSSYNWGFQLYDSDGKEEAASTVITGRWQGAKWGDATVSLNSLTEGTSTYTAVIEKSHDNVGGTKLYAGETATGNPVYNAGGLKASENITSATVNTNVLTQVQIQDKDYTIGNAAGTFTKTLDGAVTTVLTSSSGSKHEVVNSSATLSKSNIVVGNNTQLFLQTWGNGAGAITNASDIYIGKTTYTETNYLGEVINTGVAIRFGNDGSTTTLKGNIYLVEDAKIKSGGTNTITINGSITDVIDGVNTGSVLTVEGQGYQIAGTVQVSGLELVDRNSRMDFLSGSTLQVEQTIQNEGTISLAGDVVFNSVNFDNYEALNTTYSSSASSNTAAQSGYRYADQILLTAGTVINNATSITVNTTNITANQPLSTEVLDGIGLVGSCDESIVDKTTFFINENAVWDSAGFQDNTATHYVVSAGYTFDVNWDNNSGDAMNGKNIVLKENATLVNGFTSNSEAKDASLGWQQLSSITLQGNASVGGDKQFGLLGGSYKATTLTLNGHTLTKVGGNTFLLINTTVDAGVIDIQEGNIQVGYNQKDKLTDASRATVKFSGGSLTINGGDTFKIAGLTGDNAASKIKGWGNLELVGSGTYETEAALTENTKITVNMDGGTQTLRADSGWQATTAGGATEKIVLSNGTLNLILDGAELKQSSINKTGGTLNLSGNGIYDMGNSTTASVAGLTSSSWTGTVETSGIGYCDLTATLGGLGNEHSTVSVSNAVGYFNTTDNDDAKLVTNLYLVEGNAITLSNGNSTTPDIPDRKALINGDVSGSGDIIVTQSGNPNPTCVFNYEFAGDVSGWDGKLSNQVEKSSFTINVAFTGAENESEGNNIVSADILNEGSGKSGLTFGGSKKHEMYGQVDVNALNVNQSVDFYDTVTVRETLTVTDEMTAQVNSTLTASEVINNGTLKLGQIVTNGETKETKEIASITGGSMTKVQMNSTGISGTATDGTKGSISDANVQIAQLAADASFTIADMTLTNTRIVADSGVKVKLENVSATNSMLTGGGQFALNATSTVGTAAAGETRGTLSYNAGFGVGADTTLTLNLDVLNAVGGDQHGVYDLTITLSGFGADFAVTEAVLGMVKFDETSWLGQALEGAMFSVVTESAPEAAAAAAGGAPSVSYAAGSNVGTLVITINGLNVPEPTTATLSLLALAALAARRRRRA